MLITPDSTVADIATAAPATIAVFQQHHIDFCCGGRIPLSQACADKGLDTDVVLTELDVKDRRLPPDIAERDRAVADHARAFLDAALDERAVKGVVTWGITDRYSWLSTTKGSMRDDGLTVRGLPLDENMQRKPLWHAIAEAFDHAPAR